MLTVHDTRSEFSNLPCTTAVLPIGAVEQHGKHLPFGTDTLLAEALAVPIAQRLKAYLLPPIAVSASIEHRKAKGTVYLRPETLALVVRDIAHFAERVGLSPARDRQFHSGNWILKPTIRGLNRDCPDFASCCSIPNYRRPRQKRFSSTPRGTSCGRIRDFAHAPPVSSGRA
jgi:creatinine amidohydrolase